MLLQIYFKPTSKFLTVLLLVLAAVPGTGAGRDPAAAGKFYPRKPERLSAMVDRFLDEAPQGGRGRVVALLVPHAGIEFTGPTAAKAFKLLKRGAYRSVIIVGAAHHSRLKGAAIYPGAYGTPEGNLPFDRKTAEALTRESDLIAFDAGAHDDEHSIEVQIPFLRRRLGDIPQVSLMMSTRDLGEAREIGRALARVAKRRKALLVASSDMAQFPEGWAADAVDRTTLAAMKSLDPAYFWLTNRLLLGRGVEDLSDTFCGEGAVTAVMTAARALGARRLKVLEHINSGDVVSERDYHHVVGYSAAAFLKGRSREPSPGLTGPEKSELLAFARRSLKNFAAKRTTLRPALSVHPRLNLPAGAFVTLRRAGRVLRGRSGDIRPERSLLEAVGYHAVQAAFFEFRLGSLTPAELDTVDIEIMALSRLSRVRPRAVLPGRGVSLELGERSGTFMPGAWKKYKSRRVFLSALCVAEMDLSPDCYKDEAARLKDFSAETFGTMP